MENSACQSESDRQICNSDFVAKSTWTYRPHGAFARALYAKQINDENVESLDKNQWYNCNLSDISLDISSKFIQLSMDEDTNIFLKNSIEKSDWIFTQFWHTIAKYFLSWFMSLTSINGFLGRGSMFVLSFGQFLKLLKSEKSDWKRHSLLDLGAGDGEVTVQLAPAFEEIYVTEMSATMRNILQKRGYRLLDVNNWQEHGPYDVISCLNLLDRCDAPITLLKDIKNCLKPDGLLIVALVLPFSQYVESGRSDHKPTEGLPIIGKTFEEQLNSAIKDLFEPAGYQVFSWSRVPYLCEGDLRQCYYWLDDAIFILKHKQN